MKYKVYGGGLPVVSADLIVDTSRKPRYFLQLSAYTHGMLAKLAPWKGTFETKGWYDAKQGVGQPELHASKAQWRDELETKEYRYNKNGSFKEYRVTDDKNDGRVKDVDPALTQGTTDALSATLEVMNTITRTGKCEGAEDVFDGSRRFKQIFTDKGEVELKGNALNLYTGKARECTVEIKPIAGKWHAKPRGWMSIQEQGRAKGTMPTIWFATLAEGQPAVPVKIRVKTGYGTLFMHLTHYKGGEKTLKLPD